MKPARGLLFDLDDTLTDRAATIGLYAERFHAHFAKSLDSVQVFQCDRAIREADGGGYRPKLEVAAQLLRTLPWLDPPAPETLEAFWLEHFPRLAVPMSGLHEVLGSLRERGVRLGVVTNGRGRAQHPKLDALRVRPYLHTVIVSEEAGCKKPDGRIYALALERLGLAVGSVWMVGDHPLNDVIGARRAGLRGVWFDRATHTWPDHEPRGPEVRALHEVLALLD